MAEYEPVLIGRCCKHVLRPEYLEMVRQLALGLSPAQVFALFPERIARDLDLKKPRDSVIWTITGRHLAGMSKDEAARYYKECTAYDPHGIIPLTKAIPNVDCVRRDRLARAGAS